MLIKTPEPNLRRGMQYCLSGYANWYAKRNRRTGHLYQGRYKSFLVEDESYYWNLSHYIHVNPWPKLFAWQTMRPGPGGPVQPLPVP